MRPSIVRVWRVLLAAVLLSTVVLLLVVFTRANSNDQYRSMGSILSSARRGGVTHGHVDTTVIRDSVPWSELGAYIESGAWRAEWHVLQHELHQSRGRAEYASHDSDLDVNLDKNRYNGPYTFDRTRVRLSMVEPAHDRIGAADLGEVELGSHSPSPPPPPPTTTTTTTTTPSDYINANYISSELRLRAYIASQAPLPHTFADFWRCCWEQRVTLIVMLTNLIEGGFRKADRYWPDIYADEATSTVVSSSVTVSAGSSLASEQYGDIVVHLEHIEVEPDEPDIVTRVFRLSRAGYLDRHITQKHFIAWPGKHHRRARVGVGRILKRYGCVWCADHGVPQNLASAGRIVTDMLKHNKDAAEQHPEGLDGVSPIWIHCSAGVGRTVRESDDG